MTEEVAIEDQPTIGLHDHEQGFDEYCVRCVYERGRPEVVDIGDYCVECRQDTKGQDGRAETQQPSYQVEDEDDPENLKVKTIMLRGYICESCKPFENPLMEDVLKMMVERRFDKSEVREKLRAMGDEDVWSRWFEPMLDDMEQEFGLKIR